MKQKIFFIIRVVGTILNFFNLLMFYAMRPCWSGISSTLGYKNGANILLYYFPVILCVLFFIILLSDLLLKKFFNKGFIQIIYASIGFVFFVVLMVIIKLGAIDYMRFVWPKFFMNAGITAIILMIYFLIFIYPRSFLKDNKLFKYGILSCAIVLGILYLLNFSINRITYKPVVYAVEDNYQIVFSTSSEATAWVEIGDENYYDTYNGSTKTFSRIHKIEVPMTALDNAKSYTVHTSRTIYAGPFGGFLGHDISLKTEFKPVDTSDGIQYISFSDVHMNLKAVEKTASKMGDYDFLVLIGDLISDVETFDDANYNNLVAYTITKGEVPVVYARGNHDVKGRYAEKLDEFVGSKNHSFYFNFYFDNVYGVVLDIGEDHDDDWWEYYGTSHYDEYRNAQKEFLEKEVERKDYDNYDYHLAVCHIPVVFVNTRHNHVDIKKDLTALLNQMDIDMFLCGHQHEIMMFEPGLIEPETKLNYNPDYKDGTLNGYVTDFNFPTLMVTKPGKTFSDDPKLTNAKSYIGLVVDVNLNQKIETCRYVNSYGDNVEVMNMFYPKSYGSIFEIDLTTKVFTKK